MGGRRRNDTVTYVSNLQSIATAWLSETLEPHFLRYINRIIRKNV